MKNATDTRTGKIQFTGIVFGVGHQVMNRFEGRVRTHHQPAHGVAEQAHGQKISAGVVGWLGIDRSQWQIVQRHDTQGITIGMGVLDVVHGNFATSPRPVVDHNALTQCFGHALCKHAGDQIQSVTGCTRGHKNDGFTGPGLRSGLLVKTKAHEDQQKL